MGTNKRRRSSAGLPTIQMGAEPPTYTLHQETTPVSRRTRGFVVLSLLVLAAGVSMVVWALTRSTPPGTAAAPVSIVQAAASSEQVQASPAAEPSAIAVSVVETVMAPSPTVAAAAPTAEKVLATAAAQPTPGSAQMQAIAPLPSGSPQACIPVPGIPVYADAVCVEQDTDQDDGLLKHDNTYVVAATTDDVRRFFESALVQNGWTITKSSQDLQDQAWEYSAMQGLREAKIEVETRQGPAGTFTQFRIAED